MEQVQLGHNLLQFKGDNIMDYKILEDGYLINACGAIFEQRGIYSKMFVPDGSYEDNAKAQIAEMQEAQAREKQLAAEQQAAEEKKANDFKQMRADVDYLLMVGEA